MQTVTEEFKTAISEPSREIKSRITFSDLMLDNENIQSISLDSNLISGEDFEIGTAPMDSMKIEVAVDEVFPGEIPPEKILKYDYENKESNVELGLVLPDESIEFLQLGKFTVEKATRKKNLVTLELVDRMYKAEKEYVSDLMYPTTISEILDSASAQAGIELATTNFANADYIVPNEPVFEGVTCRKIFAQVAELAGGYAKINHAGELEILTLGNQIERDITKDHYIELKINEVANAEISKVIIKIGEETAESGTGENIYTIVDNMFVQNPNDVIEPIYNVLNGLNYTAVDFNWQGDFSLLPGDRILIDNYETYLFNRSLKYTGGLREDYQAPAKSNVEKNSSGKGSLTLDIENVKTAIKVIDGEIKQTIEKVENLVVDAANRLYQSQTNIELLEGEIGGRNYFSYTYHSNRDNYDFSGSYSHSKEPIKLQPNTEYTFSYEELIRFESGQYVLFLIDSSDNRIMSIFNVRGQSGVEYFGSEKQRTFTTNDDGLYRFSYFAKGANNNTVPDGEWFTDTFLGFQIEKGNIATDWTPAPEDTGGKMIDTKLIRESMNPYYKAYNPYVSQINLSASFPNSQFAENLEGEIVTMSLGVLVDVDRVVKIDDREFELKANRWTRIHITKEFPINNTKRTHVRKPYSRKQTRDVVDITGLFSITTDLNTLYYRNIQIQKGDVPTNHTMTPEELEFSVNRLGTEITQLVDSISLIATRNENTGKLEVTPDSVVAAINSTDGVGKVSTVKVTVDENGLTVEDGAIIIRDAENTAIITSAGLKILFTYTSSGQLNGWQFVGVQIGVDTVKHDAMVMFSIPEKMTVTKATLKTMSMPAYRSGWSFPDDYYHARNLRLYKSTDILDGYLFYPANSSYGLHLGASQQDVTAQTWGSSWSPTGEQIVTRDADITDLVTSGQQHVFSVATTDAVNDTNGRYMGAMQFQVEIEGYLRG